MTQSEPQWWYADKVGMTPVLLSPAAWIYGAAAIARYRLAAPVLAERPVICIGNFTAGGTGKTPLTLAIAEIVRRLGHEPWALSRGYGGALAGPVRIASALHAAPQVGDEPLLLARAMQTVVAGDRSAGARFIADNAPANAVILMDDGLQNPAVAKDLTLAVVDRARGLGNGRVIPAGPMRAPLGFQAPLANALIVNGPPDCTESPSIAPLAGKMSGPVLSAWPVPATSAHAWSGKHVVAYAGIANPIRFFALLESLGARVVERRVFADHQPFSDADAASLLGAARQHGATLATTEKDAARLAGSTGAPAELLSASQVLRIKLEFANGDCARLSDLIARALAKK